MVWIIFIAILVLFILFYNFYFLRQPKRKILHNDNHFLSPAEGKIIAIVDSGEADKAIYKKQRKVLDDFTAGVGRDATMIVIEMKLTDVHYQRAPHDARLIAQHHRKGSYANAVFGAKSLHATDKNEHNEMIFITHDHITFKIVQIA